MGLRSSIFKLARGTTAVGATSIGCFYLFTRKCQWHEINDASDSIMTSRFFDKYNPWHNPTLIDVCVRRVRLSDLPPELVGDMRQGGTKLIERFCGSVWGGFGFTPQRLLWAKLFRGLPGRSTQLWESADLLASDYEIGTIVTDHLEVIAKGPTSILFRAGKSQGTAGESLRDHDSLLEVAIDPDFDAGVADLSIKTAMYQGASKAATTEKPMEKVQRLHMWYTEMLMESALYYLRR
ncbi:hypothetical protein AYO20_09082 [Fonsecaea nubica]|uniref:Uncharacterized protein n=1 Tax=Fonsecaea nubica TaxID=856822 RepID=A0A178CIJ0_9EURO|nr:hypothetical protein AYO20_09082 [Fonsecaea nubica]OAL29790.1 hypothetical protein AYO20_09082 [Fonsecaea nubica]